MSESERSPRLRESLRACTLDGSLHAAMVGFGETYFAAFALALGATPFQAGLLVTVPILVGSGFQLAAPGAARRTGEKPWVVASAVLQAATFAPILVLGLAVPHGAYLHLFPWVCLYWILALGISPAWNVWIGRMIPPRIRGRYFGRRNVAVHSIVFLSVLAAGFLIDAGSRSSLGITTGFVAAFAIAAASRLGSAFFLTRQLDPGAADGEAQPEWREVLRQFPRQPYGRLVLLLVLMSASVHVSAAYFTPFMLQGLELSYARFTILTGTIVAARMLASPYWGEIARGYGNRRALQVAATLVVPLSALWVVSDNYAYLLGLQIFAGFAWSGLELTTFLNFFDCTDEKNRAQVLSIYNLLNGIGIVTGSILGGSLLHWIGDGGYAWIFLVSSALRATSLFLLGRGVGRRRTAGEHSFRDVFVRVVTLRPGQGPDDRPLVLPSRPPRRRG